MGGLDVQPAMGHVNQPIVNAGDPIDQIDVETQCENSNRNSISAVHGVLTSQSPNGGTLVVMKDDVLEMEEEDVNGLHPYKVWWEEGVGPNGAGGFVIYVPAGSATIQVQGGDSLNAYDVVVPSGIKPAVRNEGEKGATNVGDGVYYLSVGSDYQDAVAIIGPTSGEVKEVTLYGCIDFDGEYSFHIVHNLADYGDGRHVPYANGVPDINAPTIIHTFKIANLSIERHEDSEGKPITTGNVPQQFQYSTVSTDKCQMHPWKLGYSRQAHDYFVLNFADLEDIVIHGASSATCPRPGANFPVTTPFKQARALEDYEEHKFTLGDSVYLTCLSYDGAVQASKVTINEKEFTGLFFSKEDLTSHGEVFGDYEQTRIRWEMQSVLIGRLGEAWGDVLQVTHSQITFSFSENAPEDETAIPYGQESMYPFKTWWERDADPSSTLECPKGALVIYLPPNSIQVTGADGKKHTSNVGGVDEGEKKFELAYHYPQKFQVGAHVYLVKVGCDYKPLNEVFETDLQEQATQEGGGDNGGGEKKLKLAKLGEGEKQHALIGLDNSPYPNAKRLGDWDRHSLVTPSIFGDNAKRLGKEWVEEAKRQANKWVEETKAGAKKWVDDVHSLFTSNKEKLNAAKEAVKKAREARNAEENERRARRELARKQGEKAQLEHRLEVANENLTNSEKYLNDAEAALREFDGDKNTSAYKRLQANVKNAKQALETRKSIVSNLKTELGQKEAECEAEESVVQDATHQAEKKRAELSEVVNNPVNVEIVDSSYGSKCLYAALSWDGRITLHIHASPRTSYGSCLMDAGDDRKPAEVKEDQSTIIYWIPVAEISGCLNVQTPYKSTESVKTYKTYEISVMQKQVGTYFAGNESEAWHVGKINDVYETYLAHGQAECVQHEFKGNLDPLPEAEKDKSAIFSPVVGLRDVNNDPITSGLVYINVCERDGILYKPETELGINKNCWFSVEADGSDSGGGSGGGGSDSGGSEETDYTIHKAPLFAISSNGILRIALTPVRFCRCQHDMPMLYDFKPIKLSQDDTNAMWCVYCPAGADALKNMVDIGQFHAVIDPSFIPDPPEEVEGHKGWYKTTVPCIKGALWLMPSFEKNDEGNSAVGVITGTESPLTNVESTGISLQGKLVAYCEVGEKGKIKNYTRCCSVRTIFAYLTDTDLCSAGLEDEDLFPKKYQSIDSLERSGHYKGRSYTGGNSALELYNFHKGGESGVDLQATNNKSKYDKKKKKLFFDLQLSHLKKGKGEESSKYKFANEVQFVTRHHVDSKYAWIDYEKYLHVSFSISLSDLFSDITGKVNSYIGDANDKDAGPKWKSVSRYKHETKDKVYVFELYNFADTSGEGTLPVKEVQSKSTEGESTIKIETAIELDDKKSFVIRDAFTPNDIKVDYYNKIPITLEIPKYTPPGPTPPVDSDVIGDTNEDHAPGDPVFKSVNRRRSQDGKTNVFELYDFRDAAGVGAIETETTQSAKVEGKKVIVDAKIKTKAKDGKKISWVVRNKEGNDATIEYKDELDFVLSLPLLSSIHMASADSYIGDVNDDNLEGQIRWSVNRYDKSGDKKVKIFELYDFRDTTGVGVIETKTEQTSSVKDQKIIVNAKLKTNPSGGSSDHLSWVMRHKNDAANAIAVEYKDELDFQISIPMGIIPSFPSLISYIGDGNEGQEFKSVSLRRHHIKEYTKVFELYNWRQPEGEGLKISGFETPFRDGKKIRQLKSKITVLGEHGHWRFLYKDGPELKYLKSLVISLPAWSISLPSFKSFPSFAFIPHNGDADYTDISPVGRVYGRSISKFRLPIQPKEDVYELYNFHDITGHTTSVYLQSKDEKPTKITRQGNRKSASFFLYPGTGTNLLVREQLAGRAELKYVSHFGCRLDLGSWESFIGDTQDTINGKHVRSVERYKSADGVSQVFGLYDFRNPASYAVLRAKTILAGSKRQEGYVKLNQILYLNNFTDDQQVDDTLVLRRKDVRGQLEVKYAKILNFSVLIPSSLLPETDSYIGDEDFAGDRNKSIHRREDPNNKHLKVFELHNWQKLNGTGSVIYITKPKPEVKGLKIRKERYIKKFGGRTFGFLYRDFGAQELKYLQSLVISDPAWSVSVPHILCDTEVTKEGYEAGNGYSIERRHHEDMGDYIQLYDFDNYKFYADVYFDKGRANIRKEDNRKVGSFKIKTLDKDYSFLIRNEEEGTPILQYANEFSFSIDLGSWESFIGDTQDTINGKHVRSVERYKSDDGVSQVFGLYDFRNPYSYYVLKSKATYDKHEKKDGFFKIYQTIMLPWQNESYNFVLRHDDGNGKKEIRYAHELSMQFLIPESLIPSLVSYRGDENEDEGDLSINRRDGKNKNVKVFELHNWLTPKGDGLKITGFPRPYLENGKIKANREQLIVNCKPDRRFLYQDNNELKYLSSLVLSFPSWEISLPSFPALSKVYSYIADSEEPGNPPFYVSLERRGGPDAKTRVFELWNWRGPSLGTLPTNPAFRDIWRKDGWVHVRNRIYLNGSEEGGSYSFLTRFDGRQTNNPIELRYRDALSVSFIFPSALFNPSYIGDDNEVVYEEYHSISKREDVNGKKRVFELYNFRGTDGTDELLTKKSESQSSREGKKVNVKTAIELDRKKSFVVRDAESPNNIKLIYGNKIPFSFEVSIGSVLDSYTGDANVSNQGSYSIYRRDGGVSTKVFELYNFNDPSYQSLNTNASFRRSSSEGGFVKIYQSITLPRDGGYSFVMRHQSSTNKEIRYADQLSMQILIPESLFPSLEYYEGDTNEDRGKYSITCREGIGVKVFELYNWTRPDGGAFKINGFSTPQIIGRSIKYGGDRVVIDCKDDKRFLYQANGTLKYLSSLIISLPSWEVQLPSFQSKTVSYIGDTDTYGDLQRDYRSISRRDGHEDKTKVFELFNFRGNNTQMCYMDSAWNGYGANRGDHFKRLRHTICYKTDPYLGDQGYYSFIVRRVDANDGTREIRYVDALSITVLIPSSLMISTDSYVGDEAENDGNKSIRRRDHVDASKKKVKVFELYNFKETSGEGVIETETEQTLEAKSKSVIVNAKIKTKAKDGGKISWVIRNKEGNDATIEYKDELDFVLSLPLLSSIHLASTISYIGDTNEILGVQGFPAYKSVKRIDSRDSKKRNTKVFELYDFRETEGTDELLTKKSESQSSREGKKVNVKTAIELDRKKSFVVRDAEYPNNIKLIYGNKIPFSFEVSIGSVLDSYTGDVNESDGNKSIHLRDREGIRKLRVFELYNWQNPSGGVFTLGGFPTPYLKDGVIKQDKKRVEVSCDPNYRFLYQDNKELKYLEKLTISFASWEMPVGEIHNGKLLFQSDGGTPIASFAANQSDDDSVTVTIPNVYNGTLTFKKADDTEIGKFSANQKDDVTITLPAPIEPPSGNTLTFIVDIQYDISSHQLQKKVGTLNVKTGKVQIGDWTMITGGQATSHG